ncbi:MAG: TetR/AcrR family transcriptional regulator [Clostridium sp.]
MNDKELEAIGVKERILNVAIEEFAQNGYKAASTNIICKKADISKGLLYHYYNSKENLYITVVRHVIDSFKRNIAINIKDSNKKGIDYVEEYFDIKFKFFRENPLYSKIIVNLVIDNSIEKAKELSSEFQSYNNNLIHDVIKNIDMNPKFNKEKAFELIVMIGENLEKKHMKRINDIDKDSAVEEFRKDHREMLEMVFEGIDK